MADFRHGIPTVVLVLPTQLNQFRIRAGEPARGRPTQGLVHHDPDVVLGDLIDPDPARVREGIRSSDWSCRNHPEIVTLLHIHLLECLTAHARAKRLARAVRHILHSTLAKIRPIPPESLVPRPLEQNQDLKNIPEKPEQHES